MKPVIKFSSAHADFFSTLNQRVNEYFKDNNLSRTANTEMIFKTIFMFLLYFIPYTLIMTQVVTATWALFLLCIVLGCGTAGIGLSVMHDANHGSYSNKAWVNNLLSLSLNIVGGNSFNWKVQHNVLHHTYTNIHEVDEDINPRGVLRMTPHSEWKPIHKYQHLYAWLVYGLLTFVWVIIKDFARLSKYEKEGLVKKLRTTVQREWTVLVITKIVYIGYVVVLPIILLPLAWWQVIIGFFLMHYVAGFILAIVFQPAHVTEGTAYPLPDDSGNIENSWAVHQLYTTSNFANDNKLLSWYVGGLNFQVEHHLFPNVCHVHYRNISKIVKQVAQEFGLPYRNQPTFTDAILSHAALLKELGQRPALQVVRA